jgi:hypothetical protein
VTTLAVVVAGVVAGFVTWLPRHAAQETVADPIDTVMQVPFFKQHPPTGELVIVDQSIPGWTSVVWLTDNNQLCGGTVATAGPQRGNVALTCWPPMDSMSHGAGPPATKPVFQTLPDIRDGGGKTLGIGVARSDVATVDVTFRNHTVSAKTVPVTVKGQIRLAAYAVWLPLNGVTAYSWQDITAVVARNNAGAVVR